MFFEIHNSNAPIGMPDRILFKIITQRLLLFNSTPGRSVILCNSESSKDNWFKYLLKMLAIGYHSNINPGRMKSLTTSSIGFESGKEICAQSYNYVPTSIDKYVLCIIHDNRDYAIVISHITKWEKAGIHIDACYPSNTISIKKCTLLNWTNVHQSDEVVHYEKGTVCIQNCNLS